MNDLDRLSTLDPAAGWEPSAARRARSAAAVDRLIRENPEPRDDPRPAPRRRLVIGLAAAAVTAVAGALVVPALLPGDGDTAYASWTPVPDELTGAEALPEARQCAAGWTEGWVRQPTAADVLLAERRGIATVLLVVKDGGELVECSILDPDDGVAGAQLLDHASPPPAAGRVSIQAMGAGGGDHWHSEVVGRVGPGVTGVDIEVPDGTVVRASVRAGWWLAWWPGRDGGEVDTIRVVVHKPGGSAAYRPSELYE